MVRRERLVEETSEPDDGARVKKIGRHGSRGSIDKSLLCDSVFQEIQYIKC